jgi:ferredoxin-NADP reductase
MPHSRKASNSSLTNCGRSAPDLGLLALEQVFNARRDGQGRRPARLVALLNCGFPEPEQMRFALLMLREFAREAGYIYAGSLPVGGGEAIHGRPLASTGGMTHRLRAALDVAASALAAGQGVPEAASAAAAHPFIAPPFYRLAGWWGWHSQAHAHGLRINALRDRPFDHIDNEEWERLAASGPVRARPLGVVEKIAEGADAVTLVFEDPAHHAQGFEAGQYLTLELPIDGDRVRRAYSLSTAPCDAQWSVTVKRVPGGLVSNWIHDQLEVGSLVRSFGPSGHFTAGPRPATGARCLLLVAGGSGIVPLAVIARELLQTEPDAEIVLIYGSASLQRAIFAALLRHLAQTHGMRLNLQFVFEAPPPGWQGMTGKLDPSTLARFFQQLPIDRSRRRAGDCRSRRQDLARSGAVRRCFDQLLVLFRRLRRLPRQYHRASGARRARRTERGQCRQFGEGRGTGLPGASARPDRLCDTLTAFERTRRKGESAT